MSRNTLLAAGCAASLFALGGGGYLVNEWRVCRDMEYDFVRTVEAYSDNVYAGALAASVGADVDEASQQQVQDRSLWLQEMQLFALYDRCGQDAGRAAAQRARDIIGDSANDILSLPYLAENLPS